MLFVVSVLKLAVGQTNIEIAENQNAKRIHKAAFAELKLARLNFLEFRINVLARKCNAVIFRLLLFCDQKIVFCLQEVAAVIN